jgi:hypothetical protein
MPPWQLLIPLTLRWVPSLVPGPGDSGRGQGLRLLLPKPCSIRPPLIQEALLMFGSVAVDGLSGLRAWWRKG